MVRRIHVIVQIPAKIISKYLWSLCNQDQAIIDTPAKKKRRVKQQKIVDLKAPFSTPEQQLAHAASVLEILSWLTDVDDKYDIQRFTILRKGLDELFLCHFLIKFFYIYIFSYGSPKLVPYINTLIIYTI